MKRTLLIAAVVVLTQAVIPAQPSIGTVTFRRNASGAAAALSVSQDRVWELRFTKR